MIDRWRSRGPVECHVCRRVLAPSEITVDHLRPVSKFPELMLDPTNCLPACRSCNSSKKDRYVNRSKGPRWTRA